MHVLQFRLVSVISIVRATVMKNTGQILQRMCPLHI